MADAFIKIFTKMLEWEWYDDINTKVLFLHILLRANWKPGSWHGIKYEAGEFITSLQTLANETHLTVMQVRTALYHLTITGEITSRQQGKSRIITVNNWNLYQGSNKVSNSKVTTCQQGDNKVVTTDKEYIERKNNKDSISRFTKPTLDEVRAYCQERNNTVDPEKFFDYYESNGWKVGGKSPMKDWKSAIRNWERREEEKGEGNKKVHNFNERTYNYDELLKGVVT